MGSVSYRIADGDSDNSDHDDKFSIGAYEPGANGVEELKAAAADPNRVPCVAELSPTHVVQLRETLDASTRRLYNDFIDEMFTQLAKPYVTESNETIYIRANRATVTNIARCFAQANLLDLSLARRTRGYFIEPENLLTITVPTGLPPKATFKGEFAGTFASYHKTSWESVAKILAENCIRPASWTKTRWAYRRNTRVAGSLGTLARSLTRTTWSFGPSRFALPTSIRLARARTLRGLLPRAKPQN